VHNEPKQPLINFMVCFIERGECPLDSWICSINFVGVLVEMFSLLLQLTISILILLHVNWTKKIAQILHWFGLHGMVMIEHSYGGDVNIEDKDLGGRKGCSIHVWWGVKLSHCLLSFEKHMKGLWQKKYRLTTLHIQ
jgi:hypothetical protein